jgi:hypothetical protein
LQTSKAFELFEDRSTHGISLIGSFEVSIVLVSVDAVL